MAALEMLRLLEATDLKAMGHEIIDERNIAFGGTQLVLKLPRGWAAGSDSRKDGHAAGD